MPSTLKTIRIFVSSTFRDMHAERDYLNRFVFPELRSRCIKHGIEFVGDDLRWGVTEEEAEQHGALEICLNEIKKCNFFISLLGDRYGWVPPPDEIPQKVYQTAHQKVDLTNEDVTWLDEWYRLDETVEPAVYRLRDHKVPIDIAEKLIDFWETVKLPYGSDSITALEIIHGALESTNPETSTFFYFRKPGIHTHPHYPESLVSIFAEQDPYRKNKLTQLKQLIRNQADEKTIIREYNAEYTGLRIDPTFLHFDLGSNELETLKKGVIQPQDWPALSQEVQKAIETHGIVALSGMEELGKQITEDLWAAIETKLEQSVEPSGVSDQKRSYNERFLKERTRLFLGRQDLLESMLGYVVHTDARQPLVITGKSGCGKSALMAECAKQCREKFPNALVIPHFIGAAPGSTDLSTSIRSICEILHRECNIDDEFSTDPDKLHAQMRLFLEMAGAIRPIILLIDAVNQLEPANRSHELRWLPLNLPSGVKVIVSTLVGDCLDQLQERVLDDHIIDVPVLPEIDRKSLIQKQLANRGKKLTEGQIFRLLDTARPDAGLPLYLLVALEELCLFGDYDALNHRIGRLPSTLSELFDQVLQRLEDDHTQDITEFILRLLAVSRSGLMESEILDILAKDGKDIPNLKWTQFYRSLEFYLRPMDETTGMGLIDFYHDTLRFAVYRRYLEMASPEASETSIFRLSNNQLADYFRDLASDKDELSKWNTDHPRSLNELPYHLVGAGRKDELRSILFDFNWLQTKLEAIDVNSLVRDYDYLPDDHNASLVQNAIRMSAHVLSRDKTQLSGQLLGRLQSFKDMDLILEQARAYKGLWLCPLTSSLTPPGGPLVRTFEDKNSPSVNAVSVTPDSRHVISGSFDRTLKLWDMESGEELLTFKGHRDFVKSLVVTPDGRHIISGSDDCTLKLWDLESGEELRTLNGHTDLVTAISVTPDGRHVISASDDCTLKLWDLESGEDIRTFSGHANWVTAVSVTPDGHRVVSASYDCTLKVWDLKSGEELLTFVGHTDYVSAVSVTPDGRHVISASFHTFKLWDLESGEELLTFEGHTDWINAVSVTPNGRHVISGSDDCTLKVWDLESGAELKTLKGHNERVWALSVTPDGRHVISASMDGTLKLWNLESDELALGGHTNWVQAVSVTPDGRRVISASLDRTLKVWDIEKGEEIQTLEGHTGRVEAVAVTPDGRRVISGSYDHTLKVWDLESGEELKTLEGHKGWINAVSVTPDGRRVISASEDHALKLWDLESGEELQTFSGHAKSVRALSVTPDSRRVISASKDHTLKLWDIESGKELRTLSGHTDWVRALALTPDGHCVVSASNDCTLKVWEIESGEELRTLKGHNDRVMAVSVTPDGHRVISASNDRTLKVWDLESGEELKILEGHNDFVWALSVTPDSRRVISVSFDRTLIVWDVEKGEIITGFYGDSDSLTCTVSPDGKTIVAGERSGRLHFLRLEGVDSALNRLMNMQFVRKEVRSHYMHPVDREYTRSQMPDGDKSNRDGTTFKRLALLHGGEKYLKETRMPPGKTIDNLSAQMDEFDLYCAGQDYDTAISVLLEVDYYLFLLGHFRLMIELHESLHDKLSGPWLKARSADTLGTAHHDIGNYQKAIEYHEQALTIAREIRDRLGEGDYLGNLGNDYSAMGHVGKAIECHEKTLEIAREIRDLRGEGDALGNLGNDYSAMMQVEKAIEFYELSLAIARDFGNKSTEGNALRNLGHSYRDLEQVEKAIDYYEQALAIDKNIGNRSAEGNTLRNIGNAYRDLGHVGKVMDYCEQALEIARKMGDLQGEGINLGNIGNAYCDLGQVEKAMDYYEQALEMACEIGDRQGEGINLGNLGNAYRDLGQIEKAMDYCDQALVIFMEIENQYGISLDFVYKAHILVEQGNFDLAAKLYNQAIAIADEIKEVQPQNEARWGLARSQLISGDLKNARLTAESARRYDYPTNNHNVLALIGIIVLLQGDCVSAHEAFETAVAASDILLGHSDTNYDALDAKGLALCGLALCEGKSNYIGEATHAYTKARSITKAPGIVGRVLGLFDELEKADTQGLLVGVREAVCSGNSFVQ